MALSFSRVGTAPRFVFQISNFKQNNRGPLGTLLNEPMPTACGICCNAPEFSRTLLQVVENRA